MDVDAHITTGYDVVPPLGYLARYDPRRLTTQQPPSPPSVLESTWGSRLVATAVPAYHPIIDAWNAENGIKSAFLTTLNFRAVDFTVLCPFGTQLVSGTRVSDDVTVEIVVIVQPGTMTTQRSRLVTRELANLLTKYVSA
ncbi:hypothetical protein CONLIGDRAFT_687871 [Coniochaeta ligniaria NRRL 30616]|uniref:Uncharacterized protein n=1 Tax=Coniochaeta ligniaria NRRL 30616 TaxID=1408157 RepID=A0A1J7I393_9PEZI|nr:hypothetical protein CONLIGDRAFT_687871 [Coniochaeta ligniaria NRRL 30616]